MPEAVADPNTLVDPGFMVEGPNGSVMVDPAKVPAKAETPSERPSWLPEKFKTPEDMAKAYGELETKLGTPKPETPATVTPEQAKEKGVDLDALQKEYSEKGALSADSLTALEAKGFTKEHVAQYIAGIQATQAKVRSEFAEIAGGDESLTNVLQWAQKNLSAEEQKSYDALLDSGNHLAAKTVLKDIVTRYKSEVGGDEPALIDATRAPSTSGLKPFASQAEAAAAIADPRYAKDPAYRLKVMQRINVSDY